MICIKCKTNISDTAKFCPKCGVKVEIAKAEDVVICPKCGTPNPLTAKFCKKDGTPLREEIKSSETMKEYIKPERIIKKRPKEIAPSEAKRIPIWIAISILVVILAGGSYLYFKKSKEVSVPLQETRTSPDTAVSKKEPATIPIQPPLIPEQSLEEKAIISLVNEWKTAWESCDIEQYMSFYDKTFYAPYKKMNYNKWLNYKQGLFRRSSRIQVVIKNLQVNINGDKAYSKFEQDYRSDIYSDWGKKTLTFRKINGVWKIVEEDFVEYNIKKFWTEHE